MIRGTTSLIAHLGYPTATFKAPMIYNPYFEKHGIDAVVMPLGCKAEDYTDVFRAVFRLTNIHGALITDVEIHRMVEHLKKQGQPIYDMEILRPRGDDASTRQSPVPAA